MPWKLIEISLHTKMTKTEIAIQTKTNLMKLTKAHTITKILTKMKTESIIKIKAKYYSSIFTTIIFFAISITT